MTHLLTRARPLIAEALLNWIAPCPTVDAWFEQLMHQSWGRNRPATIERRHVDYRLRLRDTFGDVRLDRVTPGAVEQWLYERIALEGNRRCVQAAYETLRDLFAAAVRRQLIERNPVSPIRYPTEDMSRRERRVLSIDQYRLLRDSAASLDSRTMIRCLCEAGLRRSEAAALQWQDIDWRRRAIHVRRRHFRMASGEVDIDTPKGRSTRIVAINHSLLEELRELRRSRTATAADAPVWVRRSQYTSFMAAPHTGGSIAAFVRRDAIAAGLVHRDGRSWVTPHMLRASGASIAAIAGVSPLIAKAQLGHARLRTTDEHYLHVPEQRALSAFADVFTPEP